jgi:hypothetical protein
MPRPGHREALNASAGAAGGYECLGRGSGRHLMPRAGQREALDASGGAPAGARCLGRGSWRHSLPRVGAMVGTHCLGVRHSWDACGTPAGRPWGTRNAKQSMPGTGQRGASDCCHWGERKGKAAQAHWDGQPGWGGAAGGPPCVGHSHWVVACPTWRRSASEGGEGGNGGGGGMSTPQEARGWAGLGCGAVLGSAVKGGGGACGKAPGHMRYGSGACQEGGDPFFRQSSGRLHRGNGRVWIAQAGQREAQNASGRAMGGT